MVVENISIHKVINPDKSTSERLIYCSLPRNIDKGFPYENRVLPYGSICISTV